jgi:hypothetical protein
MAVASHKFNGHKAHWKSFKLKYELEKFDSHMDANGVAFHKFNGHKKQSFYFCYMKTRRHCSMRSFLYNAFVRSFPFFFSHLWFNAYHGGICSMYIVVPSFPSGV